MIEIRMTTKQAEELEQAIETHMYYCSCELMEMDNEVPEDWQPFAPYCGCNTCETRECLMATIAWLRENNLVDIYIEDTVDNDQQTLFD